MKRVYEFITKANQVLLFIAVLGIIGGVTYLVYKDTHRDYQPPHVPIAESPEAIANIVVKDVRYLGDANEIYVFGLVKTEITTSGNSGGDTRLSKMNSFYKEPKEEGEMVNVVFSKGGKRIKTLLDSDGLILSHRISEDYRGNKIEAFIFLCATADTDGNRKLDQNDQNDLYIVPKDITKPQLIIVGAIEYEVVSATRLLVKTRDRDVVYFYEVNIDSQEKKEVVWN